MFDRLINGDRAALARAITLAESRHPVHRQIGQQLVADSLIHTQSHVAPTPDVGNGENPRAKPTFRIGLSGPPGAGKSTFIEAFGNFLVAKGHRIAVLSIDPSSSVSGGSILGDKTRMTLLSREPNAYVRPSPSCGSLGGVARNTCDSIVLCEAAGYDVVLVETVGVGQSETAVADMVDMYVMIVPPAGGDVLQGLKRGIVELVDLVLVNKCDGDLLPAARRAKLEYTSAIKLLRRRNPLWSPTVLSVSAIKHTGLEDTWDSMTTYHEAMCDGGALHHRRTEQSKIWMWQHVTDRVMQRFREFPPVDEIIHSIESEVATGQLTAGQGADRLLSRFGSDESQDSSKDAIKRA